MVRSPWATTLLQVFSRVWVLWAIMEVAPTVQSNWFLALAATSWCLVEVPRYMFYALNILNLVPYPLFWLRYSLFALLYPTGITGELGCTWLAFKYLYFDHPELYTWVPLPSVPTLVIPLWSVIALVTLTYIPGAPKMYMHMVSTRKKALANYGKVSADESNKKK